MSSGEHPPKAASHRRKIATAVIKAAIGLGLMAFLLTLLRLDDVIVVRDAGGNETTHQGRDIAVTGAWIFTAKDGSVRRVDWDAYPILEKRGDALRVRLHGEGDLDVTSAELEGSVTLMVDETPREFLLRNIVLEDGADNEGWKEQLPSLEEGLVTIFKRLELGRYLLAMALVFGMYICGVTRWKMLLEAQGIPVTFTRAFRLTFIGFFFNNVVPGMTGGDLVKAVMIARDHPGKGAAAVSTVIADRVIGILVLAFISAVVLAFTFSRYEAAGTAIFLFLGGVALATGIFFSRRIRRKLRINELLRKLPGSGTLMKLDKAFLLYRSRKKVVVLTLLISVAAHGFNIVSIYLMGTDLGVDRSAGLVGEPFIAYVATVPIILIVSAVPLLPGGWGLGELAYGYFFRTVGVRNLGLSVGLSVLTRASMLVWSLLGGVFLIFHRREAREAREAIQESQDDPMEL